MITGTTVSLRPLGIGRYFSAAFLSVWLVGWVIGEVVAIGGLGAILASMAGLLSEHSLAWSADLLTSGGAAFVILFLVVWLTFWTVGGFAAITHLLRSLSGEDFIALSASGLELVRRAGPFRRRYPFERSAIRRLRIRPHDKALVADTETGTHVLTAFGSAEERQAVGDWLGRHLQLPDDVALATTGSPPTTWEVTTDGDSTSLRKVQPRARMVRALISWILTGAVAMAWLASRGAETLAGNISALVLTLLLAVGAAACTWGRREWIVRTGELTFRRSFATWTGEQTFTGARLEVTHERDSDNDSHYKLIVADGDRRQTVHSQVYDSGEVVDLGHWLARRTGFPLKLAGVFGPRQSAADDRSHS